MSAPFIPSEQLFKTLATLGLVTERVEMDDYRITHQGETVFQGSSNRCSDFLLGWITGARINKADS